ncbi:MAG: hypothetical protein O3A93_09525 [Chloroflexi bacterium]|nr:hypothetical protein [Chloroflexota bacterium]MDA1271484.1 hypothetical protein [Chloroflexota bacterium]
MASPICGVCGYKFPDTESAKGPCPNAGKHREIRNQETMDDYFQRRNLFRTLDSAGEILRTRRSKNPTNREPKNPAPADSKPADNRAADPEPVDGEWSSLHHFQGMSPRELESERQRTLRQIEQRGKPKWIIKTVVSVAVVGIVGLLGFAVGVQFLPLDDQPEKMIDSGASGEAGIPTGPNSDLPKSNSAAVLVPTPTRASTLAPSAKDQPATMEPTLTLNEILGKLDRGEISEAETKLLLLQSSTPEKSKPECRISVLVSPTSITKISYTYDFNVLNNSTSGQPSFSWSFFAPTGVRFPNQTFHSIPDSSWSLLKLPIDGPPYDEYRFTTDSNPMQSNGSSLAFSIGTRSTPVSGGRGVISFADGTVCEIQNLQVPGAATVN